MTFEFTHFSYEHISDFYVEGDTVDIIKCSILQSPDTFKPFLIKKGIDEEEITQPGIVCFKSNGEININIELDISILSICSIKNLDITQELLSALLETAITQYL